MTGSSTSSLDNSTSLNITLSLLTNATQEDTRLRVPKGCVVLMAKPGDFIPWDNPDNLISKEVEQVISSVVSVFCLPPLFFLSLLANVVNMLVFWRHGLKERINLCLFGLSLNNLLYMSHSFLCNVDKLSQPLTGTAQVGVVFDFIISNNLMFLRGILLGSAFISMLIACERCLCVYSPLRSQKILKTRATALLIIVSTVLHLALASVAVQRWSTACVFNPVSNSTSKAIYPSKFYLENRKLIDTANATGCFVPACYIVVIAVTTTMTSIKLHKIAMWREQTSSAGAVSPQEVALTRMLIGTSFLYVVCASPALVLGIVTVSVPDMRSGGRYFNAFSVINSFFGLGTYVNPVLNFFIYYFLGSKYKQTLRGMVCRCSKLDRLKNDR